MIIVECRQLHPKEMLAEWVGAVNSDTFLGDWPPGTLRVVGLEVWEDTGRVYAHMEVDVAGRADVVLHRRCGAQPPARLYTKSIEFPRRSFFEPFGCDARWR